jgi:hypothetical protein
MEERGQVGYGGDGGTAARQSVFLMMYGSDPFAYDLEAALETPSKPRSYKDTLEIVRLNGRTEPLAAPNHKALAKHAKRYGRDCVASPIQDPSQRSQSPPAQRSAMCPRKSAIGPTGRW